MKIKKYLKITGAVLMLALLTGAVLSGCGRSGADVSQNKFITIGCVAPLSGDLAPYGEGSLETEEAAVDELNESGGIYIDTLEKKMKIRFLIADSKSTAEGAKEAARQLIEENAVDVMICSSGTMTALAAASVCEASRVPFFSVNAENDAWQESGPYQYCFNCAYDQESRFRALLDVFQEKGVTSIGLLSVRSETTEDFTEALTAFCAENGILLHLTLPEDPLNPDFTDEAGTLSGAGIQGLICYMDSRTFSDAWGKAPLFSLGVSVCALMDEDLFAGDIAGIEHGGDIKEFYTLTTWDRKYPFVSSLTDETAAELALWWESTFLSSPSEISGGKHAAAEIAVNSLKLAMALDPEAITSAAGSLNVDTMIGLVDFDAKGSAVLPCSVLKWTFDPMTLSWSRELYSHKQLADVEFDDE